MSQPTDVELLEIVRNEMAQQAFRAEREERPADAERIYRYWMKHLPQDPAPKWGLSLLLLSLGRLQEGFELYEARTDLWKLGTVAANYAKIKPTP